MRLAVFIGPRNRAGPAVEKGSANAYLAGSLEAAAIPASGPFRMELPLDRDTRLRRLRFRAWHRGVREADLMVGGFFDAHHRGWSEAELDWFEALLEEQDVDIMAWALGTAEPPERFAGGAMGQLRTIDYVRHP